ncbi:MAG TPA: hypothetical protein VGH98_07065 [Gemmatimonadaceae bacterium]
MIGAKRRHSIGTANVLRRSVINCQGHRLTPRTHRVAGYFLLAGAGIVLLVAAAFPRPWTLTLGVVAVVGAGFASLVYSYFAWNQETSQ